jgi:hypothetical protein
MPIRKLEAERERITEFFSSCDYLINIIEISDARDFSYKVKITKNPELISLVDRLSVKLIIIANEKKSDISPCVITYVDCSFVISDEGKLVVVLYSKEKPGSEKVLSWLSE